MQAVGVIGLGIMGLPIAKRAAAAGFDVLGYNRPGPSRDRAAQQGINLTESIIELAESCDAVIVMVPDAAAVEDVFKSGLLQSDVQGKTIIQTCTLDPDSSKQFAQKAQTHGYKFLECPVSGSKAQVESGQLIVLASGDEAEINRWRPLLQTFSKDIVYAGEIGMASTLKICVNLILLMMTFGISDSTRIARASGLNPDLIFQVIESSPALSCGYFHSKRQPITNQQFEPAAFSLANTDKDSSFMLALAEKNGVPHKVLSAARSVIEAHMARGDGERDLSVLSLDPR